MVFRKIFTRGNRQHHKPEDFGRKSTNTDSFPNTSSNASKSENDITIVKHECSDLLLIEKVKNYIQVLEEQRRSDIRYSLRDDWLNDYYIWLNEHSRFKTFRDFIIELMSERSLNSVDFYTAAGLDRKLFSRLKNENNPCYYMRIREHSGQNTCVSAPTCNRSRTLAAPSSFCGIHWVALTKP